MKKRISFRLFFTVLFRGVWQVICSIGSLFGYRDKGTYGKVVWRIAATCLTTLLALFTCGLLYAFVTEVVIGRWIAPVEDWEWKNRYLSNRVVYQRESWGRRSRVYNLVTEKVTLEGIDWVITSDDNDSLAVFGQNGRRGYLNRFTGEVCIPPVYSRAWVFSEGVAAVEKDGELLFIDHTGKVVIDADFEAGRAPGDYVFHEGHCVLWHPVTGRCGLIDKQGAWVLPPEYVRIRREEGYWVADNGKQQTVLDKHLETVLPLAEASYRVDGGVALATRRDHTMCKYSLDGELLEAFYVSEVERMTYRTDRLRYLSTTDYDEEGNPESTTESCEPYYVEAVADGLRYQAEPGWYGLMSPDGKAVTPPAYSNITAVDSDLYLCEEADGCGVLLDGQGRRVK